MHKVRGYFFPEADTVGSRRFFESGSHEPNVRALILDYCRSFRRAVDVGAHIGLHARALADHFSTVEAFEPQPQVFACLEANVEGFGVSVHELALGPVAGVGYIPRKAGEESDAHVVAHTRERGEDPCPVRSLDEFGWSDVDLLKIGADPGGVLAGAERTIALSRPVIWLLQSPTDEVGPILTLGALGYRIATRTPDGVILTTGSARRRAVHNATVIVDDALGARLVQVTSPMADAAHGRESVALDGVVRQAETLAFHTAAGPGELLSVNLETARLAGTPKLLRRGGQSVLPTVSEVSINDILRRAQVRFTQGALRLSAPPETLAYFGEIKVAIDRSGVSQPVARVELRQAARIDDIPIRPPLSMVASDLDAVTLTLEPRSGGPSRTVRMPVAIDPSQITADQVTCYLNRGGGGNPVVNAFASSMGARLAYAEDGARDGAAIVWGVLRGSKDVIDSVADRHGYFYYIDHAYFARGHLRSYRVTRNRFEAGPVRVCPPDRLEALGLDPQPWRAGGRYILVCPPTDYFIEAHKCHSWLGDTLETLKAHTDREIIVRRKPQPGEAVTPLAEAMAGAHAVVTHSSNVAVEAVIGGTPVFVAPSSAAAPMGLTDLSQIETPIRPEREAWLAHLSYSQFSFEEVKYGTAWRLLREFETRPFVS